MYYRIINFTFSKANQISLIQFSIKRKTIVLLIGTCYFPERRRSNNKALVNMYIYMCVYINTRDFNIRYRYLFRGARSLAGFR